MKKLLILMVSSSLVIVSCKQEKCTDGKQNKKETGIDCGGECAPCATCTDGILNQDEVEIDCGGTCEPCGMKYPESGAYGVNVVNASAFNVTPGDYSMRAGVPVGSSLKIIMYNVSGGAWFWALGTNTNCIISEITSSQSFEAPASGIMQVQISLSGSGTALIQYFENSNSETKTKTISW